MKDKITMNGNHQELYDMYQQLKETGQIPKEITFDDFENHCMNELWKKNGEKPPKILTKQKYFLAHNNIRKQISQKEQTRLRLLEKLKKKKESS